VPIQVVRLQVTNPEELAYHFLWILAVSPKTDFLKSLGEVMVIGDGVTGLMRKQELCCLRSHP
jgi:hypothetical protein